MTAPIKIGISDFVRDTSILDRYDIIEIEDKKSHKLKGVFISSEYAKEVKKVLEEKKGKEVQKKLEAFRSIVPLPAASLVNESIQSIKANMKF